MPLRDEDSGVQDLRVHEEVVLVLGWTGVECMTKACGKGNVPMVKSVWSRRRVERDERSVRELVLEDLGVRVRRVPLELREIGLDVLV